MIDKPETKPKRPVGRPRKEIPIEKIVENLAARFASKSTIAVILEVDEATIRRSYAENYAKGRAAGEIALRDLQWKSAQNGSVPMQIWLGKAVLGQVERQEIRAELETVIYDPTATESLADPAIREATLELEERIESFRQNGDSAGTETLNDESEN